MPCGAFRQYLLQETGKISLYRASASLLHVPREMGYGERTMPRVAKPKPLGKVVHYYDRLGVAIVELQKSLKVGDIVLFRRGEEEFAQPIASMQIDRTSVVKAKKGDAIGVKVARPVKEGALVMAA